MEIVLVIISLFSMSLLFSLFLYSKEDIGLILITIGVGVLSLGLLLVAINKPYKEISRNEIIANKFKIENMSIELDNPVKIIYIKEKPFKLSSEEKNIIIIDELKTKITF